MTFRVTVTNSAGSSTAAVNVDATNIVQSPLYAASRVVAEATFNVPPRVLIGDHRFGVVGTSSSTDGPLTSIGFSVVNGQLQVNATPVLPEIERPAIIGIGDVRLELDPIAPQVGIAQEALDRFRILYRASTGTFTSAIDVAINNPCGVTYGTVANGQPNGVFIGQRSIGFSVLRISSGSANTTTSADVYQSINTGQSLCTLLPVKAPLGGSWSGEFRFLQDLIAVDAETNTLSVFTQTNVANVDLVSYVLKASAPIQLNAPGSLTLVKAAPVGGFFDSNTGLALVFSDGQHNGQHRLVIVGLDASRNLVQQTYTWTGGVPVDVMLDNLDGDAFPEVVVITSTSPYAVVFESTVEGDSGFLPLGAASYFDVGLGASQGLPSAASVLGLNGLYVAFPSKNRVRVFQRATP